MARQLVCARLIVSNSLSSKTRIFLKEQYVVNQSNYPDTVVEVVAMITSFGNNDKGGGRGNHNNTNKIPEAIVSIHLADCGDDCSNDNDRSAVSFESIANDRGANDDDDPPGADVPIVNSEEENDNIDENVVTNDDDTNNNDDNNDEGDNSGDDENEDSQQEGSMSDDDNTNSTTNQTNDVHVLTLMLAMVYDDEEDDPGDYNEFRSDYDLDNEGVFDVDDVDSGEGFVCMAVTDAWDPHQVDKYKDDDILLRHGVFDVNSNPSIHPNFFNGILNDSLSRPHINDDLITPTQVLHYALLRSSMRKKRGDVDE